MRTSRSQTATVLLQGKTANPQALVEGLVLGDYRFNTMRSGKEGKRSQLTVRLHGHAAAVEDGSCVARCQNLARELSDTPPNLLDPQTFAARAKSELRSTGLSVKITSGTRQLRKAGFPGLAQVGMAGSSEPALVEIHYQPKRARGSKRLALVGKGITFDSGGISLKPGDKMWEMKADMSGAAAVLAAMKHIAISRPEIPVTGYLCLAENMPDRNAQRPGDIYRARNGKYIHVDNTDAEGRLVLADVLTYACEEGATHLVDVATLTGRLHGRARRPHRRADGPSSGLPRDGPRRRARRPARSSGRCRCMANTGRCSTTPMPTSTTPAAALAAPSQPASSSANSSPIR
jgi:leucyl aminopeptidase